MRPQTQRIARFGLLTALALILGLMDRAIPLSALLGGFVPGVKLGLANLVVLSGLYRMKPAEILSVSVARILLIGFLFGNGMSIIYSLAGGLLSFLVMLLLKKTGGFSAIGVSIAGGVSHNIGQILVAAAVLKSSGVFYYLPVLMIAGILTGALMGILTQRVLYAFPAEDRS